MTDPDDERPDLPNAILPYAGNSGWSGTETSAERAFRQDEDGTTYRTQVWVLSRVTDGGVHGATVKEIRDRLPFHHGQASGALTNLHKAGYICRLTSVKRDKCKVYVSPKYVQDRATDPPPTTKKVRRVRLTPEERQWLDDMEAWAKGAETWPGKPVLLKVVAKVRLMDAV